MSAQHKVGKSKLAKKQRGPRTVVIQKDSTGFGFTLRHFIVFPPDSLKGKLAENQTGGAGWQGGNGAEAMDTIFVREVKEGSCAHQAGLVTGDRIITINNQMLTGKSYSQVIDLIQNSGNTLHLLVVPKEDDILQLYFSGSAYQPVERQYSSQEFHSLPSSFSSVSKGGAREIKVCEPIYATVNKEKKTRIYSEPILTQYSEKVPPPVPEKNEKLYSQLSSNPPQQNIYNKVYSKAKSVDSYQPVFHFKPLPEPPTSSPRSSVNSDVFYDNESPTCRITHGSNCETNGAYGGHRPYRFHDTFSRLLVDMWYPNRVPQRSLSQVSEPRRYYSNYENVGHKMSENDPPQQYNHHHHVHHHHHHHVRRDHKPGFANLLSKTMKAFMPNESHRKTLSTSESDAVFVDQSPLWQDEQMFRSLQSDSHREINGYANVRSKSDEMLLDSSRDNQNAVNLVAQRLHQFESGSINDKAQERTNMYKHELSRVSSPSPCQIVSKRAAQFESLGSPSSASLSSDPSTMLSLQSYPPSKAQLRNLGLQRNFDHRKGFHNGSLDYPDKQHFSPEPLCNYLSDSAASPVYRDKHDNVPGVIYRKKHLTDKDRHITRRISYLKATAGERMLVESDLSEDDDKLAAKRMQGSNGDHKMEKLKSFFGEKTPKIRQAIEPITSETQKEDTIWKSIQGWLTCKMVTSEGKRSADRSWRNVWAVFKGSCLHLFRDKKESSEHGSSELYDTIINLKTTFASIAHDYTKRKNVLRLRLANGTEYLFQADCQQSMIEWLCALKSVGLETEKELLWHHASVLEKAAAYEQQIEMASTNGSLSTPPGNPPAQQKMAVRLPFRHRSPTGQSPAVKTRRASHGDELGQTPRISNSLKSRVVPGWKKTHSLQSEVLPKGASVGVKLEDCPHSEEHQFVPSLVELCVGIVEGNGLELVGLYRVPGNNAAVSMLMDSVNHLNFEPSNLQDQRWNDINVVSSLLKAFFRKLPEPLLTSHLYPKFIAASKIEEAQERMAALKKLIHQLPRHHFETTKFLVQHLKRVVEHSNVNKMESRNLAIVFGPTLVRPSDASMISLVTDMSHQCYIIETFINYVDWLFDSDYPDDISYLKNLSSRRMSHPLPVTNSELLLRNVQKMDESQFGKSQESFPREFLSSVALASNRKAASKLRKEKVPRPVGYHNGEEEEIAPPSPSKEFPDEVSMSCYGNSSQDRVNRKEPLNRMSIEEEEEEETKEKLLIDEVVHHTYDKLNSLTQERIKKFEKETKALLRRDMNQRQHTSSRSRVEWDQIEKEWEKAKREMEQEDLLDYVADDPSFMTYLLNRQHQEQEQHSSQNTGDQLECISSSLENTLNLNHSNKKKYAMSSQTQAVMKEPRLNSEVLRRYSYAQGSSLPVYSSPNISPQTYGPPVPPHHHQMTATVSPTCHTLTTSCVSGPLSIDSTNVVDSPKYRLTPKQEFFMAEPDKTRESTYPKPDSLMQYPSTKVGAVKPYHSTISGRNDQNT